MTQNENQIESGASARGMYWVNLSLLAVLGAVILGFALYMTNTHKLHADLTSGGIYSLSGSTKKLLQQVDEKGQGYELVSLFNSDAEKNTQVRDLLGEYSRVSKRITGKDLSEANRDEILGKIFDRYAGEIKPYENAVSEFEKLSKSLDNFSEIEGANLGALAQKEKNSAQTRKECAELQGFFNSSLKEELARQQRAIRKISDSKPAEWWKATASLKTFLDEALPDITSLADKGKYKETFSAPLIAYLDSAADRYKAMSDSLKTYKEHLDKLPPLKVQDVIDSIGSNTIIVLGPTAAKVIGSSDIYKVQRSPNPRETGPTASFEGEQAVSSAILGLVRPDKVKVVFISAGSGPLSSGAYSMITDRLKDLNFEVMDWSPPGGNPGERAPADPNPPAEGKGVVWIVFPPEQSNPQMAAMGMPAPSPTGVIEAVKKHIADGGQVLIFAEQTSTNPFASEGPAGFPYEEITRGFGVDVKANFMVLKSYDSQEGSEALPLFELSRFPEHPITKPIQSLPTRFVAVGRSQMGFVGAPTVVGVDPKKPADVDAQVIVDTGNDRSIWGESTVSAEPKFDPKEDLASPVPLAVAASKKVTVSGKQEELRIVVIGSKTLGRNELIQPQLQMRSGALYQVVPYPGNAELFVNSVLWLSGYENMIAVSAKSNAALRIRDIQPAVLTTLRWGVLWGGAPAAALIAGAVVYAIRRR